MVRINRRVVEEVQNNSEVICINKNSEKIEKDFIGADRFGFDFCKVDDCTLYLLIIISYFIEHVSRIAQNVLLSKVRCTYSILTCAHTWNFHKICQYTNTY